MSIRYGFHRNTSEIAELLDGFLEFIECLNMKFLNLTDQLKNLPQDDSVSKLVEDRLISSKGGSTRGIKTTGARDFQSEPRRGEEKEGRSAKKGRGRSQSPASLALDRAKTLDQRADGVLEGVAGPLSVLQPTKRAEKPSATTRARALSKILEDFIVTGNSC